MAEVGRVGHVKPSYLPFLVEFRTIQEKKVRLTETGATFHPRPSGRRRPFWEFALPCLLAFWVDPKGVGVTEFKQGPRPHVNPLKKTSAPWVLHFLSFLDSVGSCQEGVTSMKPTHWRAVARARWGSSPGESGGPQSGKVFNLDFFLGACLLEKEYGESSVSRLWLLVN